jgi:hypothetical protein
MPKSAEESKFGELRGRMSHICPDRIEMLTSHCRTHRDRKATYVKALELEVAKLRSKDASAAEGELHSNA